MALREVFGRNVRSARIGRELTQEQLAFEADVKRGYISEIERGKRNPSLDVVEKLALALGVSPSSLLQQALAHDNGHQWPTFIGTIADGT